VEYPEIDPTGPEWEVRSYFDWVGAARREVRPWVDVAVWVSLAITLASWVDYVWRLARIINK